jgi:hypothetical protein
MVKDNLIDFDVNTSNFEQDEEIKIIKFRKLESLGINCRKHNCWSILRYFEGANLKVTFALTEMMIFL